MNFESRIRSYIIMFVNQPGFEGTEQNRSCNTAQQSPEHQNPKIGEMFRYARQTIQNSINEAIEPSAVFVGDRAHESSKKHAGPEAGDE